MQHWFVLFQSCSTGRAGCNNDSIELNSEHGSFGFKLNFKLKKMSAQQTSTNTSASASASILASNFEDEQQEDVKEKQEENLPMTFHIYNKTRQMQRNNISLKSEVCFNIRVWTSKTRERSKRKGRVCEYSPHVHISKREVHAGTGGGATARRCCAATGGPGGRL